MGRLSKVRFVQQLSSPPTQDHAFMLPNISGIRKPLSQNSVIFRSPDYQSGDWKKINQQLPPDHVVRRISKLVDHLDLTPLLQLYQHSKRRPLDPKAMLKVVLYEIHQKTISPARWHRDSKESLPVLWLLGGLQPGRSTFYEFQPRFDFLIDELNALLRWWHYVFCSDVRSPKSLARRPSTARSSRRIPRGTNSSTSNDSTSGSNFYNILMTLCKMARRKPRVGLPRPYAEKCVNATGIVVRCGSWKSV